MKSYTITVNGTAYEVTVEETWKCQHRQQLHQRQHRHRRRRRHRRQHRHRKQQLLVQAVRKGSSYRCLARYLKIRCSSKDQAVKSRRQHRDRWSP